MPKKLVLFMPMWSDIVQTLVKEIVDAPESEGITLYQNTPGGSVFAGWGLTGVIKDHAGEFIIKAFGDSSSMGFYLLLYADKVESLDVTKFTIHRADAWADTEDEKKRLESINKDLRAAMESRIDEEKFVKITGKTFDEIFDPEQRISVTITAKEAKKLGIVNTIMKLEDSEIKALNNTIAAFSEMIETPLPGDEDKNQNPKSEVKPQNNNKMNIEKFKSEHPEIYANVFGNGRKEGLAAEKTRVKALLAFHKHNPESVVKAINEDTEPDAVFIAEMSAQVIAKPVVAEIVDDSPEAISARKVIADKKDSDKIAEEAEKEAFASAGIVIKKEEDK